jgi:hypothetical protein
MQSSRDPRVAIGEQISNGPASQIGALSDTATGDLIAC